MLEKRSALEQGFMDQYLKACESYETQLEAMRAEEAEEYAVLKRRWGGRGRAGEGGRAREAGQGRVGQVKGARQCVRPPPDSTVRTGGQGKWVTVGS